MPIDDPELTLAISYARASARPALAALFGLDAALGGVLRTTSEPMLGQMRLTWWHDALERLDTAPAPAESVLQALAATALPARISGARLAEMLAGWEALLEPELDDAGLRAYARDRGGRLFALAGRLAGFDQAVLAPAGEGWALADLALHSKDEALAERARLLARIRLDGAAEADWPSEARTLGALVHLARLDLALPAGTPPRIGAPRRVARMLWHRFSGR